MAKTEQDHHRKAFELYFSLGAERSYKEVARQMGVSPRAIKLWSKSFDWPPPIGERDAEVARQSAVRKIGTAVIDRTQLRKITRLGLMRVAKALADGRDISKQIADLDRSVRSITYLDGGPKGPDPNNVDEARNFLNKIPDQVLQVLEREGDNAEPSRRAP